MAGWHAQFVLFRNLREAGAHPVGSEGSGPVWVPAGYPTVCGPLSSVSTCNEWHGMSYVMS